MHDGYMMSCIDQLILQQREMQSKIKNRYIELSIPDIESSGGLITVITYPRQAGKSTTALCQIINGIPAADINFDDEELAPVRDFLTLNQHYARCMGIMRSSFWTRFEIYPSGN